MHSDDRKLYLSFSYSALISGLMSISISSSENEKSVSNSNNSKSYLSIYLCNIVIGKQERAKHIGIRKHFATRSFRMATHCSFEVPRRPSSQISAPRAYTTRNARHGLKASSARRSSPSRNFCPQEGMDRQSSQVKSRVIMTWNAETRARHVLDSRSFESQDSDVSEARSVDYRLQAEEDVQFGVYLPQPLTVYPSGPTDMGQR